MKLKARMKKPAKREAKIKTIDLQNKRLPLRTIFWGYHHSGWKTYNYLKKSKTFKVIAIILPSDRQHKSIDDLRDDAVNYGAEVFKPADLKDRKFVDKIKRLNPDIYIVDSYTKLIPSQLLSITGYLNFNLHPGLLPGYRGAHILNWVLINGKQETGITLHLLSDKFDEGLVVDCKKINVRHLDNASDIDARMNKKIPFLLSSLEEQIKNRRVIAKVQLGQAHHYKARRPEDGKIDVNDKIQDIYNKIRALTYPWPGAYLIKNNKKIIIWQAFPLDLYLDIVPGELVEKNKDVFLVTGGKKLLYLQCVNDLLSEDYLPKRGAGIIETFRKGRIKMIRYESIFTK